MDGGGSSELERDAIRLQRELSKVRASTALSRDLIVKLHEERQEIKTRTDVAKIEEERNREEADALQVEVSDLAKEVNAEMVELERLMADSGEAVVTSGSSEGQRGSVVERTLSMISGHGGGDSASVGGRSRRSSSRRKASMASTSSCGGSLADELEGRLDWCAGSGASVDGGLSPSDDLAGGADILDAAGGDEVSVSCRSHDGSRVRDDGGRRAPKSALQKQWEASRSSHSIDSFSVHSARNTPTPTKARGTKGGEFGTRDDGDESSYRTSASRGSRRRERGSQRSGDYSGVSGNDTARSRTIAASQTRHSYTEGPKDGQGGNSVASRSSSRRSTYTNDQSPRRTYQTGGCGHGKANQSQTHRNHDINSTEGGTDASRPSRAPSYTEGLKDGQQRRGRPSRAASYTVGLNDGNNSRRPSSRAASGNDAARSSRTTASHNGRASGAASYTEGLKDGQGGNSVASLSGGSIVDRRANFVNTSRDDNSISGSSSASFSHSVFGFFKGLGDEVGLGER